MKDQPATPRADLPRPLIQAAELRRRMVQGTPDALAILDARFDLVAPQAGGEAFVQGHVPGARYVHLDQDLCGAKTGVNGRHPLPDRNGFAQRVAAWGITPETDVVVYDDQGSMFAARLWWMLRWIGHERVTVLDGGLGAWRAAAGEIETGAGRADTKAAAPAGPDMPAMVPPDADAQAPTLDASGVLNALPEIAAGRLLLLDARAPERFRGEVEPLDRVPGHIPGAVNRFFKLNLDAQGRFLPSRDLRAAYSALLGGRGPAAVIHQCGSGVTACHNLLAMAVAGLDGGVLYPGSWSEWCADPMRPVVTAAGA